MKTIKIEGQSKVVEYERNGKLHRSVIPVDSDNPELGAPYGVPFAIALMQLKTHPDIAQRIENELHKRGIWTVEDIEFNPSGALSAVQAAYAVDAQKLLSLAKRLRRK